MTKKQSANKRSEQKMYTSEELGIYTTIVLRYYNYYLEKVLLVQEQDTINDATIARFNEWYSKFVYDGDMRTTIKKHNQTEEEQNNEESI